MIGCERCGRFWTSGGAWTPVELCGEHPYHPDCLAHVQDPEPTPEPTPGAQSFPPVPRPPGVRMVQTTASNFFGQKKTTVNVQPPVMPPAVPRMPTQTGGDEIIGIIEIM